MRIFISFNILSSIIRILVRYVLTGRFNDLAYTLNLKRQQTPLERICDPLIDQIQRFKGNNLFSDSTFYDKDMQSHPITFH